MLEKMPFWIVATSLIIAVIITVGRGLTQPDQITVGVFITALIVLSFIGWLWRRKQGSGKRDDDQSKNRASNLPASVDPLRRAAATTATATATACRHVGAAADAAARRAPSPDRSKI